MEDFLSIIVGGGDLPNLVLKCCDTILVYFSFQQIYYNVTSILNEIFYFNVFAFSMNEKFTKFTSNQLGDFVNFLWFS